MRKQDTKRNRGTLRFCIHDRAFRNKSVAGRKGMQRRWHATQPSSQEAGCTPAHNSSAAITEDNSVMTNTQEENNVIKKKKKDNSDTENTTNDNNVIADDNNVMENITDDNTDKIEKIKKQIENINNNINNINIKKENSPKGELKKKNPSSPSTTPEERMNAFYESMVPYADQYDRDMLNDFYQYWTEMDRRRRRMRFEMQKTWETGKRLSLWARKSFRFHPIC